MELPLPFQQKSVLPAESATIWRSYSWSVICRVLRTAASNWAHKSLYSCSVIQCLATACFRSSKRSYCQEGGICPSRAISISVRTSSSRLSLMGWFRWSFIDINTHRVYSILLLLYHNKMCSQNDITSFRWFRNAHIWTRPSPDSRSPKPAALQNRCSGHTVHLQRSNNSDRIIIE